MDENPLGRDGITSLLRLLGAEILLCADMPEVNGEHPSMQGWNTYGGGGCLKMCKAGYECDF